MDYGDTSVPFLPARELFRKNLLTLGGRINDVKPQNDQSPYQVPYRPATSHREANARTYNHPLPPTRPTHVFILYNTLNLDPLTWYVLAFIHRNVSLNHRDAFYINGLTAEMLMYVWFEYLLPVGMHLKRADRNQNKYDDIDFWFDGIPISFKYSCVSRSTFIFDISELNGTYYKRAGIHSTRSEYYLVLHKNELYLIDRQGVLDEVKDGGGWDNIHPYERSKMATISKRRLLSRNIAIRLINIERVYDDDGFINSIRRYLLELTAKRRKCS